MLIVPRNVIINELKSTQLIVSLFIREVTLLGTKQSYTPIQTNLLDEYVDHTLEELPFELPSLRNIQNQIVSKSKEMLIPH